MSTVNFLVPEEVKEEIKEALNCTFEGQNKCAIIADLMRKAVAVAETQRAMKGGVPYFDGGAHGQASSDRRRVPQDSRRATALRLMPDATVLLKWLFNDPEHEPLTCDASHTLYHAVALETDAALVTVNRRYLNKARALDSPSGNRPLQLSDNLCAGPVRTGPRETKEKVFPRAS